MSQLECGAAHLGTYDLPLHIAAVFIVLGTSAAGVGIPLVTGWIRGRDGRKASEGDSAAFGSGVGWVRNGFFLARHFGTVSSYYSTILHDWIEVLRCLERF
jgi:zinc transporter 1/2/3